MRVGPTHWWGDGAALPPEFGTLADDYFLASCNTAPTWEVAKGFEGHYDPAIIRLAAEAPLHRDAVERISLPRARGVVTMPLGEAIARRTSGRVFGPAPLPAELLGTLLFLGNGVRQVEAAGTPSVFYRRNAPNAGNLGSVEIFPIVMDVAGIDPGIYHFDSVHHDLARLRAGQFRDWLGACALYQVEFAGASVALVLTGAIARLRAKYGERALRFSLLDTGLVAENVYLVGAGLGLLVCATAGFVDAEINAALDLDGLDTAPLLVLLVGTPPERRAERGEQ
jgi:SagB-type dehydrogenase family enzyme